MKLIITRLCFWADACTLTPNIVLVHPRYKDHFALIEHEKVHTLQMIKDGTLTFWLKYWFSREYRKCVEVEAYKVQLKCGATLYNCAYMLSTNYRLGITQREAEELLSDG